MQGEGSRVFQSGARLSQDLIDAIPTHAAIVMRPRDNSLLATASLSSADYGSGDKFIYSENLNLALEKGETYFIALWDYKNADEGQSMSEDLEARQFGLVEDYPRLATGSSIEVLGPATAGETDGALDTATLATIYLDPSEGKGFSQGYGPPNLIYTSGEQTLALFTSIQNPAPNTGAFAEYRGVKLTIGSKPILLTHLGRYRITSPVNSKKHHVIVIRVDPGVVDADGLPSEIVASVIVNAGQTAEADGYNYARLENPIVLEPGATYYIASREDTANGDAFVYGGSATDTPSSLWGDTQVVTSGVFTMDPQVGAWQPDSGHFAPIVNAKIH